MCLVCVSLLENKKQKKLHTKQEKKELAVIKESTVTERRQFACLLKLITSMLLHMMHYYPKILVKKCSWCKYW